MVWETIFRGDKNTLSDVFVQLLSYPDRLDR